mgnify:CR=1 FL=1
MIHGVLNVYKEKGFTSHDVVAKLRGITKQKKIGHTGTLDPDACGVLPVCLGKATKLCDMLTDKDKVYETVLLLGKQTDTQDISGEVLKEADASKLSEETVKDVIMEFMGDYSQIPPMYSALKVNGKKLYELAREGKTVERKAREVKIYEIEILETSLPRVKMRVRCSKGTYIRTLCHDIGERLGVGGCMEELLRTKVERFEAAGSKTLSEIEAAVTEGRMSELLVPVDEMFDQYQKVTILAAYEKLIYNGNPFPAQAVKGECGFRDGEWLRVYDMQNMFIGIYAFRKERKEFTLVKMFMERGN